MPVLVLLAALVGSWALNQLVSAYQASRRKARAPDAFQNPTVATGLPIPVLYGTWRVRPITTWWGGARTHDLKTSETFLLGALSVSNVTGYMYGVQLQGVLCWGKLPDYHVYAGVTSSGVVNMIFGDKYLLSDQALSQTSQDETTSVTLDTTQGIEFATFRPIGPAYLEVFHQGEAGEQFFLPNLYGGYGKGGGVRGMIQLMIGSGQYGPNPMLQLAINPLPPTDPAYKNNVPAYSELATVVFGDLPTGPAGPDLIVGETTTPPPIDFVLQRGASYPIPGAFAIATTNPRMLTHISFAWPMVDMNAAEIIHDVLRNPLYGLGVPPYMIDDASFLAAYTQLVTEKLGMSMLCGGAGSQGTIQTVIEECERTADAVLTRDPETFRYALKLIRNEAPTDVAFAALRGFDESTIRALTWTTLDPSQTINHITVEFTNPERLFETDRVSLKNDANATATRSIRSASVQYLAVTDRATALTLCARDLKARSLPLGSGTMKVTRAGWDLERGDVFKLSYAKYGLAELLVRVVAVDLGEPTDSEISVDLAEDVFHFEDVVRAGTYTPPPTVIFRPIVRPSVISSRQSQLAGSGTLTLTLLDPEHRITEIAFQTQIGGAPPSAWDVVATATPDTSDPTFPFNDHVTASDLSGVHTYSVPLSYSGTSAIGYRITYVAYGTIAAPMADSGELLDSVPFPATMPPRLLWGYVINGDGTVTVTVTGLDGTLGEAVQSVEAWLDSGTHSVITVQTGRTPLTAVAPPWVFASLAPALAPGATATVHVRATLLRYADAITGDETVTVDDQLIAARTAAQTVYPMWNIDDRGAVITAGEYCYLTLPAGTITGWKVQASPGATARFNLWKNAGGGHALPTIADSLGLSFGPTAQEINAGTFGTPITVADGDNVTAVVLSNDLATTLTLTLTLLKAV